MSQDSDQTFADLRRAILDVYEAAFRARPELASGGQPQVTFQVLYAAALMDVAAELAIDAGMARLSFQGIAEESYTRGASNAPTFG